MRKNLRDIEYMKIHVPTLLALAAQRGVQIDDALLTVLRDVSNAVQRVHNVPVILQRASNPTRSPERVLGGLLAAERTLRDTSVAGALDEQRKMYLARISAKIAEIRKKLS